MKIHPKEPLSDFKITQKLQGVQLVKHIIQLWLLCKGGFPLLYLLILIALVTLGEDIIHDHCHRVAIHGFLQRIFTAGAGI